MSDGKCPDCGVAPGQPHDHGCDMERCVVTGAQWIACEGHGPHPDDSPEDVADWWDTHDASDLHDCGSQIWDGLRFTTTAQPGPEGEVTVGADGRVRFRGLVTRDPVSRIKPITIQAGNFTDGAPYLIVEVEGETMALGNDDQ